MNTVVTAEPPDLLRCTHCGATMSTAPPGLRADILVLAMLRFTGRHEAADGRPRERLLDADGRSAPLPHVATAPRQGVTR